MSSSCPINIPIINKEPVFKQKYDNTYICKTDNIPDNPNNTPKDNSWMEKLESRIKHYDYEASNINNFFNI